MVGLKATVAGLAAAAAIPMAVSAAVATLATRPELAAKAFGGEPNPRRHPSELGLAATDVSYSPGCPAWWVPAQNAVASVVIVHGFEASDDARATDPGPRLELAALLVDAGFNCLIISLGYSSGAHLHSGGALEANDIAAAVRWARSEGALPVAVFGFSAGGHAAVAATSQMRAFAVATDSSFVDFGEVVIDQGAAVLPVPSWLFGAAPRLMKLATGHAPIDLQEWPVDADTPMLHIHGDADEAIPFTNLARMAAITGGETETVRGADHIQSLLLEPDGYADTVIEFLRRALALVPANA